MRSRASRTSRPLVVTLVAIMAAASTTLPASALPDGIPDIIPGVAEPVARGDLLTTELASVAPTLKTIDGDISDWVGTSARISGATSYDRGELIHTDFLWDAYGADDGGDIGRWEDFAGNFYEEKRTARLDALLRTTGSQLGVPEPIGADDEYGDVNRNLAIGDITEVRIGANDANVQVLVRTANMDNADDLVVLLLADTKDGGTPADATLGLPDDHRYDVILPVSTGAGGAPAGVTVAANADAWTNAVEIAVPAAMIAPSGTLDLAVMTAMRAENGNLVPLNMAFRHAEPVDIYNDRMQSFAFHGDAPEGSSIDLFSSGPVNLAELRAGRTQSTRPGPGYHERHFDSGDNISFERSRDGRSQPYGMYIPTDFDPTVATPLTFWLHYRGGKAHSGAAINPRLIHELAQEDPSGVGLTGGQGNIIITPHARGTSFWYVSRSHQDFFEVFADAHGLLPNIDPQRRYLSGYSMGGYGTYLLGTLYPDLFAAGYSTSGAVTQGAWTGVKDSELCDFEEPITGDDTTPCYIEANSGDAASQLTYRVLDNMRHVPIHIDHGTNDELVPVTGVQLGAARLIELGYRVEMQTFAGYEHFTQAGVDEWVDGSSYLQRFTAPVNPRHVTYRVVPALIRALNTIRVDGDPFNFSPDGAYWVDGIEVRDADPTDPTQSGLVDVVATKLAETPYVTVPVVTTPSPGHSTPFTRHGLDWLDDPISQTPIRNGFTADLTAVTAVTFDAARMGLVLGATPMPATIVTDGPSTVTLASFEPGTATLTCDCGDTFDLAWETDSVDLVMPSAGTWTFTALAKVVEQPSPNPTPTSTNPTPAPTSSPSPTADPKPTPTPEPTEQQTSQPRRGSAVRVGGQDRVATAIEVSRSGFSSADTVLLARADDYPDALAGAPLAVRLKAPILLTATGQLSEGVLAEIERLGADDVVILGGENAVSAAVASSLSDSLSVRRIFGPTRFDTAGRIADELGDVDRAYVVEGANVNPNRGWPDAVSVAPIAARGGAPILLTTQGALPDATIAALDRLQINEVTVVGGEVAVSSAVVVALERTTTVTRIAGVDRYDTAARVAASLPSTTTTTWIATGNAYPDALTAGPVIATNGDRLLLVDGRDATRAESVIESLDTGDTVIILGGPNAITDKILTMVSARVS